MADVHNPAQRSANMAAVRNRDTRPEMLLRKLLHSHGFRYSLQKKELPGKPDLFLKKHNLAIFVNGCYWHAHTDCRYFKGFPKTNTEFWENKLLGNRLRDTENIKKLHSTGYRTCVVWECSLKGTGRLSGRAIVDQITRWLASGSIHTEIRGAARQLSEIAGSLN